MTRRLDLFLTNYAEGLGEALAVVTLVLLGLAIWMMLT